MLGTLLVVGLSSGPLVTFDAILPLFTFCLLLHVSLLVSVLNTMLIGCSLIP